MYIHAAAIVLYIQALRLLLKIHQLLLISFEHIGHTMIKDLVKFVVGLMKDDKDEIAASVCVLAPVCSPG